MYSWDRLNGNLICSKRKNIFKGLEFKYPRELKIPLVYRSSSITTRELFCNLKRFVIHFVFEGSNYCTLVKYVWYFTVNAQFSLLLFSWIRVHPFRDSCLFTFPIFPKLKNPHHPRGRGKENRYCPTDIYI